MKIPVNIMFIALLVLASCKEKQENWISLFNGKDLTGWKVKISGQPLNDNYKNTFIVEDHLLKVNYQEYDSFRMKFGHLYFETPYSYYRIRFDYRFIGEALPGTPVWAVRNSGVMLHSQSAEQQELNQNFPVSIEMQLLGAVEGEDRKAGNLASPGTHVTYGDSLYTNHMLYASKDAFAGESWISAEAIVLGDSIIHHVIDNDTVLTYHNPVIGGWEKEEETGWVEDKSWVTQMKGTPLKKGYIALQAEGHAIHFRNIRLLDLSDQFPSD